MTDYTPEMRERDKRLEALTGHWRDYHTSHDAKAALLEWVRAQDRPLRLRFATGLHASLGLDRYSRSDADDFLLMMTATPEQVAIAVDRAIQEATS